MRSDYSHARKRAGDLINLQRLNRNASPRVTRCPAFAGHDTRTKPPSLTALRRFPVGLNRSDGLPAVSSPAKAGDPVLRSAGVTGFPAFAGNDRGELVAKCRFPTDWEPL